MVVKIKRQCPECHEWQEVTVEHDALNAWSSGEKVQKAFPELTASQRELFLSGICSSCWDKLFKEEED